MDLDFPPPIPDGPGEFPVGDEQSARRNPV
jgi:hypothetical protein